MSDSGVERTKSSLVRDAARFILGALLIFTGISHLSFGRTAFYAQVPPWLPLNADFVVTPRAWSKSRSAQAWRC
ncbi:MAG: hypothetical protein QOG37_1497 [Mycobacterium sp.]|jgi:hypothetical protein|nr:hypothetical protein [Mycobacterium sp.]